MSEWMNRNNAKLKYIMGLQCAICGYDKYKGSLHIHHIDQTLKNFEFRSVFDKRIVTTEEILLEMSNGCTLCGNCHNEVHGGVITVELKSTFSIERWNECLDTCSRCGVKSDNPFYFTCRCRTKVTNNKKGTPNKVGWDKFDVLLALHRNDGNFEKAGREFNVTGNAVKKQFHRKTGFRNYQKYEKEKNIFSFKDGEVTLNYVLPDVVCFK